MKSAAIVGCGNIAGFLDSPEDNHITTHAHAYLEHPNTHLIAVCDPDRIQREKFISRWDDKIRGYDNLSDLLLHEKIDILSICSPTLFHADALAQALDDKNIETILCEKPFVQTQEEIITLMPLVNNTDKTLLINFTRRYDPSTQEAKSYIQSNTLGELLHFTGIFTKGLYHNGSHMLELIEYLCGKIQSIKANKISSVENDLYGSFYLETTCTHGTLNNQSGDNYGLFELELIFSKGRIRIKDLGHCIEIDTVEPSTQYPGYFKLNHQRTLADTMTNNLLNTLEFILNNPDSRTVFKEHFQLSEKLLHIKNFLYEKKFLEFT